MGKPKGRNPKHLKAAKKKGLIKETKEDKYSIDQVLDKAEELIDQYDYQLGQKFCQRALEMNPDCIRALELSASLLIEAGDIENAKHCLGRAIAVEPDQGHRKFLSLAQIFEGKESLNLYQNGIRIMENQLKLHTEGESQKDLSKQLSNAFCSIAELFITDLCDEPEAEDECQSCISKAIEACPDNPEAWQTKARYEAIKTNFKEAKQCMKQSLSLWLPSYQNILENNPGTSSDFDPVETCSLLYTTRIGTSKLLIELEMMDEAQQVLDGLLEEDDDVVEVWYLLGWLNYLRATHPENPEEGYMGNARFYLDKAKKVHTEHPTKDVSIAEHIEDLIAEIGEPEQEEEDDDNWDDIESSEEEEKMDE